ncbi:hypothetical protein HDU83_003783 [Entophlyctis luteolus]|nr:hypothetical protein HDU83_003783 [Entophlyctis luteolus]
MPSKNQRKKASATNASTKPELKPRSSDAKLLANLHSWFRLNKITYDASLMTIVHDVDSQSFSVRSNKTLIRDGTVLAQIPKIACLSKRNCAIADLIESEQLTGTLALTLAVFYERHRRKQISSQPDGEYFSESPWQPYLDILPRNAPLPLFYEPALCTLLEATDVDVEGYRAAIARDFSDHILPILVKHRELLDTGRNDDSDVQLNGDDEAVWLARYMHASSIVSSRAFHVDMWHGDALVPLADLFDHSGHEDVHVEGDGDDVCIACGAVECDCLWSDDESDDANGDGSERGSDHSDCAADVDSENGAAADLRDADTLRQMSVKELLGVLAGFGADSRGCLDKNDIVARIIELGNAKIADEDIDSDEWEDEEESGSDWLFSISEDVPELADEVSTKKQTKKQKTKTSAKEPVDLYQESNVEEQEDSLTITAIRSIKPNAPVFNTYGQLPNSKLLNLYGFAELNNPHNTVCVDGSRMEYILKQVVGEAQYEERCDFWFDVARALVTRAVNGDDESEDDEDEGIEDDDSGSEHDGSKASISSSNALKADSALFAFGNNGEATRHLIAFLHFVLLDPVAFRAIAKEQDGLRKRIEAIVERGLDSWTVVSSSSDGSGALKGKKKGLKAKATENPIAKQIKGVVCALAEHRLERYGDVNDSNWQQEIDELAGLQKAKDFGNPMRWVLIVRTEERRILSAAKKMYSAV